MMVFAIIMWLGVMLDFNCVKSAHGVENVEVQRQLKT